MNPPTPQTDLAAVISFEYRPEQLRACLKALVSWIPEIIVVLPVEDPAAQNVARELDTTVCAGSTGSVGGRWETGKTRVRARWTLFLRSNEIVTGQLRKSIVQQVATGGDDPRRFPLPLTTVFLKKRLKYPLEGSGSPPSCLVYLPSGQGTAAIDSVPCLRATFDGELIRYAEETLAECVSRVLHRAQERAERVAGDCSSASFPSLFWGGLAASAKSFFRVYFKRKGFKEGYEGAVFALFDAGAVLLGHLKYYEEYVRGGKALKNDLDSLKQVLVIKLRDIGDNILCTPLVRNLKQLLPQASVSVLTYAYSLPVFEANPHLHRLFGVSKEPSAAEIHALTAELNSMNFDLVMSTHSGGLSSDLLSRIQTGHRLNNYYRGRNRGYSILTPASDHYRSSIERDLDCLRSLGLEPVDTETEIFLTQDEIDWARGELKSRGMDPARKTVLIHPTAAEPIREWPSGRFGELIRKLDGEKNVQTLVICTEEEFPRVEPLFEYAPGLTVLHQMNVRQMMAIVHECDLVIDNDSSPSHVATALGIPTLVLFSQAIREIFRPYHPERDRHFVFYNDVDCRECELVHCDNRICLDFSPEEVFVKALEMISRDGDKR